MNRNLKMTIWVLALGLAFTGFSTTRLAAAVPAQQDQDHDRNRDRDGDRHDNRNGDGGYFEQGLRDGQHDRQYGGNRSDHRQPRNPADLRAYQDGYRQGFRNSNGQYRQPNPWTLGGGNGSWFEQGLRDGQHDRRYGGNRSDHQQPRNSADRRAYQDGYRQGFRNSG